MQLTATLDFGHEDRRRIYEYVERHGTIDAEAVRDGLDLDPRGFRHHLAILKRDGKLEEEDGTIRIAFEDGATEQHRTDGVAFAIRQARQEDLSGLVGAIRQVAEERTYIVAESVADEIDHEEVLLRHNEIESRMFFVATVGSEVVGWVHLNAPELEKLAHTAELTVGVLEEYRGHGIGSHLLERGLEWAGANGYEKIYNSVPSVNEEAIEFLEDHGWEIEAIREDHYKLDGTYADEVMMAVRL
ncbi:MAG: bifunctional helix-turn-helix transcriptional regulator/GNAT family N-acetyltransferase [Halobacteriales archaeon]|nr:bifunctional helix-turn-helix transcriptional regulator/GNAT family N-acetyltransferase [Halobacteriales archaeon]